MERFKLVHQLAFELEQSPGVQSLIITLCLAGSKQTQLSHIFLLEIKLKHIHTLEAKNFISASTV